jgi:hypothetical protein
VGESEEIAGLELSVLGVFFFFFFGRNSGPLKLIAYLHGREIFFLMTHNFI